ncbi:hypothetical protein Bca52824_090438 [Brassica carinata]|uniref:BHLH domain-containing protein n=1 Tax=Brassica carinata TaxID=52824 RepID=A0A8X7NXG4_BRACI|nr:hypothetical protein Bca52824_090438 [Brassica carinata]
MMMNGGEATEAELFLNCDDMSVLERQRVQLNYHQYHHPGFDPLSLVDSFLPSAGLDLPEIYGELHGDARISVSPGNITTEFGNSKKVCNEKKKMMMMMDREVAVEEEEVEVTKDSQRTDYIHVRARRGQATDSHSIAERVRERLYCGRMKFLQDLVPGCEKITGKAGMLDEIINYVQSLQRQVEFLSMKLATVSPRLDFNIDDIFSKENGQSATMWDSEVQNLYTV